MKGLTDGEGLLVVDSYATTKSDKTWGTTELLLSSCENKSLDLTVMGSINTPTTKKIRKYIYAYLLPQLYMHTYTCTGIHTYTCTDMDTYIVTYMLIHMLTQILTHMHKYL